MAWYFKDVEKKRRMIYVGIAVLLAVIFWIIYEGRNVLSRLSFKDKIEEVRTRTEQIMDNERANLQA